MDGRESCWNVYLELVNKKNLVRKRGVHKENGGTRIKGKGRGAKRGTWERRERL